MAAPLSKREIDRRSPALVDKRIELGRRFRAIRTIVGIAGRDVSMTEERGGRPSSRPAN